MFVLTVFITALLWVTFGSNTSTHAVDGPTASWKGESILYNGHQYFDAGETKDGDSIGLPQGTHYYLYTPGNDGNPPKTQKAFVIYFAPGTDPPTEKTATLVTYDYSPAKVFSHPTDKKTIPITVQGKESSYSSCTIQGIGWIICPITTFLADGMDNIFNIVKGFLVVQPANTTNTDNDLYIAWNTMRSVANIAFIIVFLIIIYSQLTNMGVSNYGLKKLLPRLVIAAVLVNVSYIICAVAVDLSNILGYSLQDIFNTIRQNTFNISDDTWSNSAGMGWQAVAAFVLSGGAATIGAIAATGGTIAGAIYLLVPVLIGLMLTILFVLLILAARQAIIIILIVIAPLAFVAYLLPNTEQWFKKWRELFMTMLVFFPAFSLVFGGSQLAGGIIVQNATSIIGVIFGLAVQVAPLIITPLLLKLSGGLLGRIAGMVNDPKKGLLDRTKAWSGARAEMHKNRGLSNSNTKNPFRRVAQRMAYDSHRVEKATEMYKTQSGEWMSHRDNTTRRGQQIEMQTALSKLATEESQHSLNQALQEARAGSDEGLRRLRMQEDVTVTDRIRARINGQTVDEMRTSRYEVERDENGNIVNATRFGKYAAEITKRAVHLDQSSRVIETATAIATNKQVTNYAKVVESNAHNIQQLAGGIGGEVGAQGALAAAFKAQAAAHNDAVSNANSILNRYNYGDDVIVEIAKGNKPAGVAFNISPTLKEAAIMKIAGGGNAGALLQLMQDIEINPSEENQDFRQAYADTLLSNGAKPKFAGASIIANIKQGDIPKINGVALKGKARLDNYIANTVNANKFGSADVLVGQDKDYLIALEKTLRQNEGGVRMEVERMQTILDAIATAEENPIYSGRIAERKEPLENIKRLLSQRISSNGIFNTDDNRSVDIGTNQPVKPTDDETMDMNQDNN